MHCLLLHGIAGSPFEMRLPAEALEAAGFAAHTPVLPGHGSTEEAYLAADFAQWRAFARAEYVRLRARAPVLLAGYSLGGILALDLAVGAARGELPPPAGILALATPLFFHKWHPFFLADRHLLFLPLQARLRPALRLPPRDAASRAVAPWQGHERICSLRHFLEIERALPAIRAGLPLIRAPLCIVQLRSDRSCHPYNALYLARHTGSALTELHLLRVNSPRGGHLPTTHLESRERVAALAAAFAREVAAGTKACNFTRQRI
ncbi:alpha/beta fold hydrolase [Desulfovibrio sp. ZJ200]|uniref:alpha/beta hydrolase n=1 Tax=Desulfovibrio sp. ZJ200 TaxID=2709792 RepID=UPI0013EA6546|nr:alpha/beta fold hydrolase [Desulfovibrio sp. ZJ200]